MAITRIKKQWVHLDYDLEPRFWYRLHQILLANADFILNCKGLVLYLGPKSKFDYNEV